MKEHPKKEQYANDKEYYKAWEKHFGTPKNRSQKQWRRLIDAYGIEAVKSMDNASGSDLRRKAGLKPRLNDKSRVKPFKQSIASLRKAK